MLTWIDGLLNRITMYRLVLYFLILLLAIAAVFGYFHILPYGPVAIVFGTIVLLLASLGVNELFAWAFAAQPNVESVYITALILALIITPISPNDASGIFFLIWASAFAIASKYMFAIHKKHVFNPAAFGVALTAVAIGQSASWWVGGNIPMLAFVLVGGLLVTRKIQRFDLVLSFFVVGLATTILLTPSQNPFVTLQKAILHAPYFFFAFIMLTEPLTTPPKRVFRIAYGAFVGALFSPAIHVGAVYSTPELALLVGNLFSYLVSPKVKYLLSLQNRIEVGKSIHDFIFVPDRAVRFRPGQYMEWTLAHAHSDDRGNRRYFTLASSPTEKEVHLGIRFNDPSSSFKKKMLELPQGGTMIAGQLAGEFTLPKDPNKKLVFIAGGIGITPFRSMVKYLVDRGEKRLVTLFYSNRTVSEIAYKDIFDEAERKLGMRTIYAITDPGETLPEGNGYRGRIDAALIQRVVPDYRERMFYVSGTHAMVTAFKKTLHDLGVHRSQIKTDFFPGFA
jgi:ferredoxin-NADP reductase/Na+-translocating ferredoxin:NAD+ oxidoreductase RnfD subunit